MTSRFLVVKTFLAINIVGVFLIASIINNNFALSNNLGSKSYSINFRMLESTVKEDSQNSVSSLNIQLPSSSLNLSDIEINFTNIKFGIDTKIIEDQNYTEKKIYYQNKKHL